MQCHWLLFSSESLAQPIRVLPLRNSYGHQVHKRSISVRLFHCLNGVLTVSSMCNSLAITRHRTINGLEQIYFSDSEVMVSKEYQI